MRTLLNPDELIGLLIQRFDTFSFNKKGILRDEIEDIICNFFSDKICIQKLETRHEDADILHQIVELGEGEWTHDIDGGNWIPFGFSDIERYRLSEEEDDFEYTYQWMIEGVVQSLEFHTEEEMDFMMHKLGFEGNYEPIETSKKRTCK